MWRPPGLKTKQKRRLMACAFEFRRDLLLGRRGLARRGVREHRTVGLVGVRHDDGQGDGGDHEEDGGPGGELGEKVGGSTGTKGGLRTLTTKGASEIGGFALLKEDDTDEEEADDNVQDQEENEHGAVLGAFKEPLSGWNL